MLSVSGIAEPTERLPFAKLDWDASLTRNRQGNFGFQPTAWPVAETDITPMGTDDGSCRSQSKSHTAGRPVARPLQPIERGKYLLRRVGRNTGTTVPDHHHNPLL